MYPSSRSTPDIQVDQLVTVGAHTRDGGVPAIGWARIAFVLHSLREVSSAVVVVDLLDDERILVDWGRDAYWWLGATTALPERPRVLRIRMSRVTGASVPFVQETPDQLDTLLWHAGRLAFPGEAAPWLATDKRFRATGWPNFTLLDHEPEHVRMTALLSRSAMTVEELARAARVETIVASDFVNALSMLDLIAEEEMVAGTAITESRGTGLFARLRARWGADRG